MNPAQPNVVVFLTDQQRHDTTGVHGCPLGLTPNFDRMARHGTHVAHSFTCQPVCAPARAALQTGMFATQTGVWRNGAAPRPDARMLGSYFAEAGYSTGYIGKWHLAPHEHRGPVPRHLQGGYEYWLAANLPELVSGPYDTRLWDSYGEEHALPGYRVDAVADAAIRHLAERARARRPFFLFVSLLEPHHQNHADSFPGPADHEDPRADPWMPPDLRRLGGSAPQHWPGYCAMVRRCDDAFGRVRDALLSLRLSDSTIVLFASDHGCHFKTRNAEYKRSCHDASIRVPTALCGPGFDGGGRIDALCSLVDVAPTLLDAAGIPVPPHMTGRSIRQLVRGGGTDWPTDVFVQISENHTGRCVRTHRWKYSVRCPEARDDGRPTVRPDATVYADDFLYDLRADPWELTNLVGMEPFRRVVDDLRHRLVRRLRACGEPEPRFIDAPSVPAGQRRPEHTDPIEEV